MPTKRTLDTFTKKSFFFPYRNEIFCKKCDFYSNSEIMFCYI